MKKKNTITSPRMWSSQRAVRVVCVVGVLIALVIRGALFGHFPNGLNRDEASLGYNAWLIGLTGTGAGMGLPVSISRTASR
jgi:hypothetical protein